MRENRLFSTLSAVRFLPTAEEFSLTERISLCLPNIKEQKEYKKNYTLIHTVEVKIKNKTYTYRAYLDTGNKLEDPYKKRAILLVYDKKLGFNYNDSILVPYQTIDGTGVLKCHKVDSIKIDNIEIKNNVLIGESKQKFNIEGVDCILPNKIKEEFL